MPNMENKMTIKPVYEFLLWDNCNNNCKFCFQRKNGNILSSKDKVTSLGKVLEFLDSEKYIKGSHILLVGGEIFDESNIPLKVIWMSFIDKIVNKMMINDIDLLYINTNLLYEDLGLVKYLLTTINKFNLWDRLKFTTSYDLEGRFAIKKREKLFLHNLYMIKYFYPKCNIVVNTILTNVVCEKILNGDFNPKAFCEEHKCDINLIPYIVFTKELSATREQIFKALLKTNELIPGYFKRYTDNLSLPQEKLLYKYNKDTSCLDFISCSHLECGHSENFKLYSENNSCFICELIKLSEIMGE